MMKASPSDRRAATVLGAQSRPPSIPADHGLSATQTARLLHLLEIGPIADIAADQAVQVGIVPGRSCRRSTASDPRQIDGQAGASSIRQLFADAPPAEARYRRPIQHRLDRTISPRAGRRQLCWARLANSWDVGQRPALRVCPRASARAPAHGPLRNQRPMPALARIPHSALSLTRCGETDARQHFPYPRLQVPCKVSKAVLEILPKIRTILDLQLWMT